jgi:hypothetical protein
VLIILIFLTFSDKKEPGTNPFREKHRMMQGASDSEIFVSPVFASCRAYLNGCALLWNAFTFTSIFLAHHGKLGDTKSKTEFKN